MAGAVLPHPSLFVSVNQSGRQIAEHDLAGRVREALAESGLSPHSLQLEAAEGALAEGSDAAFWGLGALGVRLCIDDFGTASSTFGRLHRLPVSTLKVDRALTGGMADGEESADVVRTILMWGRDLCMDVVAKGVETKAQAVLLRGMGCRFGQGYDFGTPARAEAAEQLINRSGRARR